MSRKSRARDRVSCARLSGSAEGTSKTAKEEGGKDAHKLVDLGEGREEVAADGGKDARQRKDTARELAQCIARHCAEKTARPRGRGGKRRGRDEKEMRSGEPKARDGKDDEERREKQKETHAVRSAIRGGWW